jgi:hypothetical protein
MFRKLLWIDLGLLMVLGFVVLEDWAGPMPKAKEGAALKGELQMAEKVSQLGKEDEKLQWPIPPVRPEVILRGLAIVGQESRAAMVSGPARKTDKGEPETMIVRVGDRIAGYTVVGIAEDRITLKTQGDSFDVLLHDQARRTNRPAVAGTPAGKVDRALVSLPDPGIFFPPGTKQPALLSEEEEGDEEE